MLYTCRDNMMHRLQGHAECLLIRGGGALVTFHNLLIINRIRFLGKVDIGG